MDAGGGHPANSLWLWHRSGDYGTDWQLLDGPWRANVLAGVIQVALLVPALWTGKIEWVALVVLVAYASQALVYVPALRREFAITLVDVLKQLWPVAPAMLAGWGVTHLLLDSTRGSLFTLVGRLLFTAVVTALAHGIFSGFRCFRETRELLFQKFTGKLSKAKTPVTI